MSNLCIVDSHAMIHRSFHALPPFTTSSGIPTGAVYGYLKFVLSLLKDPKVSYLGLAFDTPEPTFRHDAFVDYKATRKEIDTSLVTQFPIVEECLQEFELPYVKSPGFEADDIIGSMTEFYKDKVAEVIIISGDRDLFQLIGGNVSMKMPKIGLSQLVDVGVNQVIERMEVRPDQVVDFKSLCGDPSDNISGVPGIGKKTAADLLSRYDTFEGIYDNLEALSPSVKKKLVEGRELGERSRMLAQLSFSVPDLPALDYFLPEINISKAIAVCEKYELRSLIPVLKSFEVVERDQMSLL